MESITKNRQSIDVLRTMVARAYGEGHTPPGADWASELGHGWFNVAYRLRLRDRDVVLKIAPPPEVEVMTYERGAMRTEIAGIELIRRETSVPVPEIDYADFSHELCDADYFFMPYVHADNLGIVGDALPPAEREAYVEEVGALNRELNTIRGDHFGRFAGVGRPTWREAFVDVVEDVLTDGERRRVDLGLDYDLVRAVLAEHAPALDEVSEPQFIEWDLWNSNVMVRDGRIVCIIDHERAFFGDPLMEAGFAASELPAFGDATTFMRGYGRTALTETERVRRRLYNLHLILIMVIETVYRGHTDSTQYDWARQRLGEVLTTLGHLGS